MSRISARFVVALALTCIGVTTSFPILQPQSALAAPKAVYAPQLGGHYRIQGTNPNGAPYQGRATITVKNGTTFIRWEIAGQTFHGQGVLTGSRLVIDWVEPDPVIYSVNSDGSLFGTWAKGRATDNLSPIR